MTSNQKRALQLVVSLAIGAVCLWLAFRGVSGGAASQDVSLDVISQPPSVDRLVRFLGRRMPDFGLDDESQVARFREGVPALLRRTWEHVGEERVREYLESSTQRARASMKEYLS